MTEIGTENLIFERRADGDRHHEPSGQAQRALAPDARGHGGRLDRGRRQRRHPLRLLTGAGGTFCSGMDLTSMAGPEAAPYQHRMQEDPDLHWKALLRHYQLRKPLIAAVEGSAVAGGTEILQATDIRVAGESATFGVFEARRGLFPLGGSTVRLRRQIPFTVAMDLLLTARAVTAEEALRIGLMGGSSPTARRSTPRSRSPRSLAPTARSPWRRSSARCSRPRDSPRSTDWPGSSKIGSPIFATNDAAEGQRAFAEKRPPAFTRT